MLGIGGMLLTIFFAVRFVLWFIANSTRLYDPQADPLATLTELWQAVRWTLLSIAIFVLAWLWALVTSWQILHSAKAPPKKAPPRLG